MSKNIDWIFEPRSPSQSAVGDYIPGKILHEDVEQLALFLGSDSGRMCTRRNFFIDAGLGA